MQALGLQIGAEGGVQMTCGGAAKESILVTCAPHEVEVLWKSIIMKDYMLICLYRVVDFRVCNLKSGISEIWELCSFHFFKLCVCAGRLFLKEKLRYQLQPCGLTLTSIKFISKHRTRMYGHLHACMHVCIYETSIMDHLTCSCYFREKIFTSM